MTNITKERRLALQWLENEEGSMSYEDFAYKVVTGIEECKDYCPSREYCELGACRCVREAFPTPQFYELYLHYREQLTELERAMFAADILNTPNIGEE